MSNKHAVVEEAAEEYSPTYSFPTTSNVLEQRAFIAGAKWQADKLRESIMVDLEEAIDCLKGGSRSYEIGILGRVLIKLAKNE